MYDIRYSLARAKKAVAYHHHKRSSKMTCLIDVGSLQVTLGEPSYCAPKKPLKKLVNTKQPVVSNNLLPHHLPHQMASSFITLNIYIYTDSCTCTYRCICVTHPPTKKKTNITNNIRKSNTFLQPPSPPARLPALVLLLPGRGKHEDAVEPWDQNPSCERGKNVHLRCLFRWLLVQF